jgi:predicted transcriptional regulator
MKYLNSIKPSNALIQKRESLIFNFVTNYIGKQTKELSFMLADSCVHFGGIDKWRAISKIYSIINLKMNNAESFTIDEIICLDKGESIKGIKITFLKNSEGIVVKEYTLGIKFTGDDKLVLFDSVYFFIPQQIEVFEKSN